MFVYAMTEINIPSLRIFSCVSVENVGQNNISVRINSFEDLIGAKDTQ